MQRLPENSWDVEKYGEPVNQECLADAVVDLSLWTGEGLKKVGLGETREEQEARFHLWQVIGFLLGLRDELRPQNLDEGLLLRDIFERRLTRKTPEGAVITAELLGIAEGMLPRFLKHAPAAVMRDQLGDETADILQVPNRRLFMLLLTILSPFWGGRRRIFAHLVEHISPRIMKRLIEHYGTGAEAAAFFRGKLA